MKNFATACTHSSPMLCDSRAGELAVTRWIIIVMHVFAALLLLALRPCGSYDVATSIYVGKDPLLRTCSQTLSACDAPPLFTLQNPAKPKVGTSHVCPPSFLGKIERRHSV